MDHKKTIVAPYLGGPFDGKLALTGDHELCYWPQATSFDVYKKRSIDHDGRRFTFWVHETMLPKADYWMRVAVERQAREAIKLTPERKATEGDTK